MENENLGMTFDSSFDTNLIDQADYEVVISKAEKRTVASSGKVKLAIDFKIRDDVDQKFKNKHAFDDLWQDKNNSHWFDLAKLNNLIKTQKGLPTYKETFSDVDECIQYLNGLQMIITIAKEFDDYRGEDVNRVKYLSARPTQHFTGSSVSAPVESAPVEAGSPLPDNDLPW